ncbi:uncharacterized protein LOC119675320 [Teleopsis dalmanni]|uniref:uncharacterized protein LOC119675320 n=1 Tax=Teleopsis dalmanni TaxID=139649 RepID=UPI0018CF26B4|nr:uncharacterized protein LOC119675320 [Teleopsis dalmanni]
MDITEYVRQDQKIDELITNDSREKGGGGDPETTGKNNANTLEKAYSFLINENDENVLSSLSANNISVNDEDEVMKVTVYDSFTSDSDYLNEFVEKRSAGDEDNIKVILETSTDITYLQNEVNKLRHQLAEIQYQNKFKPTEEAHFEKNVDTTDTIIVNRKVLQELESKMKEADSLSANLSKCLDDQSEYIDNIQDKCRQMQEFYREQLCECIMSGQSLKSQNREMQKELYSDMYEIQKLAMQNGALRNEIMYKDVAVRNYEAICKQIEFKAKMFRNSGYSMGNSSQEN